MTSNMTVLITLTLAGADTGPFNLYSDADGFLVPFETSVLKSALVAGYTSVVVPDGSTIIRVQSNSACTNYVNFPISGITTTTTSSTSTSTSTSTTTTTTSAAITYIYYTAEIYDCTTCDPIGTTTIGFPTGTTVNTAQFYHQVGVVEPTVVYKPIILTTEVFSPIMDTTMYASCVAACSVA
jgi:hypothetical protein